MRKLSSAAVASLWLASPTSQAAPPDTSSMPQLVLPQATPAEDAAPSGPQFTYSVTAASNYIFRGVSQTENDPAVFGAARVTDDQFYAGAGIENVDFHNSTDAEYDLSGGWTPVVEGFRLDLGVIRYGYIDEPVHTHIDTVDLKGVVLHDFGPANFFGAGRDGIYFEGRGTYKITDSLSASGALGRQTVDGGIDHTTWNAGLDYAVTKNISIDARYYDTDEHSLGSVYGSHFVAAIKGSF
jgi:uncharacterized protein (TIGR02001 family)